MFNFVCYGVTTIQNQNKLFTQKFAFYVQMTHYQPRWAIKKPLLTNTATCFEIFILHQNKQLKIKTSPKKKHTNQNKPFYIEFSFQTKTNHFQPKQATLQWNFHSSPKKPSLTQKIHQIP